MDGLWETVTEIVSRFGLKGRLRPDEIRPEDSFFDLGVDSLKRIEMELAFEEKFPISITDKDSEKITNVGDLVAFVIKKI